MKFVKMNKSISKIKNQQKLIQEQYILIEKLLSRVENLKSQYTNIKKRNNNMKNKIIELEKESEMYKDYCRNITHIKWKE